MKYIMICVAAVMLVACGQATDASKTEAAQMDVAATLPALSGNDVWTMDSAGSSLTFIATHNSREFTGKFSNFAASIKLNPENTIGAEIHAAVDLSSVDAGDRDRNANLPSEDWFNTASFPIATFSSKEITSLGGGNYKAAGELTLKSITRPIILAFSLNVNGDTAVATGGTEMLRTDFNVGEGPDFSGDDWVKFPVSVMFEIKASR